MIARLFARGETLSYVCVSPVIYLPADGRSIQSDAVCFNVMPTFTSRLIRFRQYLTRPGVRVTSRCQLYGYWLSSKVNTLPPLELDAICAARVENLNDYTNSAILVKIEKDQKIEVAI